MAAAEAGAEAAANQVVDRRGFQGLPRHDLHLPTLTVHLLPLPLTRTAHPHLHRLTAGTQTREVFAPAALRLLTTLSHN